MRWRDTARIIRAFNELVVDYPSDELLRWEPLVAIHGSVTEIELEDDDPAGELTVLRLLIADRENPSSITSSVTAARANLRTTREVLPREAWQAVNQLAQYVDTTAPAAVERQLRDRFLLRVVEVSRRLDGVLESTMTRANPYRMLRLGRLVERADMTTRVLGVAAASILYVERTATGERINEEVRWMSVLRLVSAPRCTSGVCADRSTRSRRSGSCSTTRRSRDRCRVLDEIRSVLVQLPSPQSVLAALDEAEADVACGRSRRCRAGSARHRAMDRVQTAIAAVDEAINDRQCRLAALDVATLGRRRASSGPARMCDAVRIMSTTMAEAAPPAPPSRLRDGDRSTGRARRARSEATVCSPRRVPGTWSTTCPSGPTDAPRRSRADRGGSTRSRSLSTRARSSGCRSASPNAWRPSRPSSPTCTANVGWSPSGSSRPRSWRRRADTASTPWGRDRAGGSRRTPSTSSSTPTGCGGTSATSSTHHPDSAMPCSTARSCRGCCPI
ncbi:MAG: alpha-E domain-containing protein [Ilumatobacteraceae bacterium]